jgi:hypothetical protein
VLSFSFLTKFDSKHFAFIVKSLLSSWLQLFGFNVQLACSFVAFPTTEAGRNGGNLARIPSPFTVRVVAIVALVSRLRAYKEEEEVYC